MNAARAGVIVLLICFAASSQQSRQASGVSHGVGPTRDELEALLKKREARLISVRSTLEKSIGGEVSVAVSERNPYYYELVRGIPKIEKRITLENIEEETRRLVREYALFDEANVELRLVRKKVTSLGRVTEIWYGQHHGGLPVHGSRFVASFHDLGNVNIVCCVYDDITLEVRSKEHYVAMFPRVFEAFSKSKKKQGAPAPGFAGGQSPSTDALVIYPLIRGETAEYRVCWRLALLDACRHIFDAETGEEYLMQPMMRYAGEIVGAVTGDYWSYDKLDIPAQPDIRNAGVKSARVTLTGPVERLIYAGWDGGYTLEDLPNGDYYIKYLISGFWSEVYGSLGLYRSLPSTQIGAEGETPEFRIQVNNNTVRFDHRFGEYSAATHTASIEEQNAAVNLLNYMEEAQYRLWVDRGYVDYVAIVEDYDGTSHTEYQIRGAFNMTEVTYVLPGGSTVRGVPPCAFQNQLWIPPGEHRASVILHEYGHCFTFGIVGKEIKTIPYDQLAQMASYPALHPAAIDEAVSDYIACDLRNDPGMYSTHSAWQEYNPIQHPETYRTLDNRLFLPYEYGAGEPRYPHSYGEILAGGLWDLRRNTDRALVASLLYPALELMADVNYINMNSFVDLLVAVDDKVYGNDNRIDGSPHLGQICYAFEDLHNVQWLNFDLLFPEILRCPHDPGTPVLAQDFVRARE
jgi:hypothetical protein